MNTELTQGLIVLNSVTGQKQAIEKIHSVKPNSVFFFLDNDHAGKGAFENIRRNLNIESVENYSSRYSGFKDYSDYWKDRCSPSKK